MPLRRANSVPVHPPEVSALDTNALQQLESEVHVPSAPSNADPRSPTTDNTTTTFSPVFDLELGSAASTPQAPQRDRQRSGHRGPHRVPFTVHHDPGAVPFANGPGHPPPLPSLRQQQLAPAVLPTAAAAAVRQQPLVQRSPATVAACAAAAMDRSQSDLQVMLQHSGVKAVAGAGAAALTPAAQRIMDLCRPANELELELSRRLRAFRAARIAKPVSAFKASSGALAASASAATSTATATPSTYSSTSNGVHTQPHKQPQPHPSLLSASSSPPGPTPGEIEALATELLGAGFVVQLLDGTRLSRDTRSCLRTLKHRFLVCVGWDRPAHAPGAAAGTAAGAGAASGLAGSCISGDGACSSGSGSDGHGQGGQGLGQGDSQPHEPLVVEVRFREQFLIAHPTRGYEQLLLAMPVVFVGTLRRLDAVVEVMAAEVAAAFRQAGRPLPPWRTKGAMLSKWAPEQLCDLSRLMQQAALMQHMAAAQQAAAAAEHGAAAGAGAGAVALVTGPLAPGDLDASWGSGITVEQPAAAALWGGAVGVGPVGVLPAHYANLPGAPSAVAAAAAEAAAAAAGPGAGAVALAGGGTAAAQQATSYVPMMPSAFANCVSGTPAAARGGGGGGGMGPIAAVAAAAAAGAGGCGGPHSARLRAPSHGPPTTTGFFYVRDEPNSGELDLMGFGDLAPAKSVSAPSSSHTARVHLLSMAAAGAAASYGGASSVGGAGSFNGSGAMAGSVAHVLSVGAAALQDFGAGGDGGAGGLMAAPPVAAPAAVGAALGQAGLAAHVDRLLPLVAGSGSPASAASALAASAMPAAGPLAAPERTLRAAAGGKAAEAEASDAAWGHGARGQSAFAALARAQAPASPEQALGVGMGVHGMDAAHVLNTHDMARIAQTSGYYGSGGGGLPGPVAVYRGSGAVASGPAAAPAAAAGAAWHPLAPPPHLSAPHATVTAATGATGGFAVAPASGLLEPSPSFEPVELTVGWPDEDDDDEGDDRFDDDDGSLGAAELPPTLVGSSGDAAFGGGGFGSAVGSSGGLTFPILPGAGLGLQHPVQQLDAPVSADGILLASELPAALRPPSGGAVSPFARASMPEGICGGTGGGGRDGSAGQAAEYWDSGDATPEARTSRNAAAAAAAATTGPAASGNSAAAASGSSSQHGRSHLGHSQHAHHGHGQHVPGNGSGDSLPEFTLRHSALGHLHHYNASEEADLQLDASRRHNNPRNHNLHNGQGAAAGRAATLPVPTPPRAAGLASAATVPAADSGSADRDVVGALVRLHRPTSALARAQQLQLQQEQEQLQQQARQPLMPLAAGAAAGHSAFAAAPQQQPQQQPQQPRYQAVAEHQQQQQHHGEGGGGSGSVFMLHQMASDVLRITRRSSSDLSRAALKFKNAKSLLAAALRRPRTGSKDGTPASIGLGNGGAGVALPVASPLAGNGVGVAAGSLEGGAGQVTGAGMQQAQPQQPRDGGMVRDSTRLRVAGAGAGAGAAAAGAGSGAAGKEQAGAAVSGTAVQHHQHHHGATQVALAGGVMTKPSADEPAWARISTVRWGPAPAQAPAAAAAVVVAPAPAGSARPVAAGAPQPIAGR